MEHEKVYDVTIVGAGISGLACAYYLQKALGSKCKITILEGRERIGGRMHTLHYKNGETVDVGASFIHGTYGNPIYSKKMKWKLRSQFTERRGALAVDYDGTLVDTLGPKTANENWYSFVNLTNKLTPCTDESGKEKRNLKTELSNFLQTQPMDKNSLTWRYFNYNRWCYEHWEGGDLKELSFKNFIDTEFEHISGGNVSLADGYESFIKKLLTYLPKVAIQTSSTVTQINYSKSKKSTKVITSKKSYTSDFTVITVPLGVLKKQSIQFEPELPQQKQESINKMGMGLLNKIVLKFKHLKWLPDAHIARIIYIGKRRGEYPWFNIFEESNSIVVWTAAKFAWEMESKSNDEIQNEVLDILFKTLKNMKSVSNDDDEGKIKILSRLMGSNQKFILTRESLVDLLEDCYITRWGSDQYSYGSYSFLAVDSTGDDIEQLGNPVENLLFFAGEATERSWYGTVHGAWNSGKREARRIIKEINHRSMG